MASVSTLARWMSERAYQLFFVLDCHDAREPRRNVRHLRFAQMLLKRLVPVIYNSPRLLFLGQATNTFLQNDGSAVVAGGGKLPRLTIGPRASVSFLGASLGPSLGLDIMKISTGIGGLGISSCCRILAESRRQSPAAAQATEPTFCRRAHE